MSFDALAPHYRWMESVLAGKRLQRCRVAFLREIRNARNALVVGEGRGRFLSALVREAPELKITCVDSSSRMLEFTQRDLSKSLGAEQVRFVCADIRDWIRERGQYDLIATHFFLDCFLPGQQRAVIEKLSTAAMESAVWLLSDFQIPRSGPTRWRAEVIVRSMYLFFRAATKLPATHLSDPDDYLRECGFSLQSRRVSEWGLLRSDYWTRRRKIR